MRSDAIVTTGGGMTVVLSGDLVRAACVARGWSLTCLAREARLSRPTIAAVVRGAPVRPSTAWRIRQAMNRAEAVELSGLVDT